MFKISTQLTRMNCIVSSIPGRLRLRNRALRDPDRHARLQALLEDLDGTLAVDGSTNAGSLLMRYDAERIDRATMEAQVTTATGKVLGGVPETVRGAPNAVQPPSPGRWKLGSRRAIARRLNTYSKIGMLGSLGASLALAAVGNKHLHAATGGVFTALLAIHMAVHRRHLLK